MDKKTRKGMYKQQRRSCESAAAGGHSSREMTYEKRYMFIQVLTDIKVCGLTLDGASSL